MTAARVSVIIVNYNGAHLLRPCLDGLARQRTEIDFDTIVVDNASVDDSLELLANDFDWVQVIASAENTGFAGGNNLALGQVQTPYAVLLNNDAVPEPGWLKTLVDTLDDPANVDVGIVTGKVLFAPRFLKIDFSTPAFHPGPADTRELGVRIYAARVADSATDHSDKTLWQGAAYGPEGSGDGRFRWTQASGSFLVPIPVELTEQADGCARLAGPVTLTFDVAGPTDQDLTLSVAGGAMTAAISAQRSTVQLDVPAGAEVFDVVNNAGSNVYADGSGGDRGFQLVDNGQFEQVEQVFAACGNGMALRTAIGREVGWFDDAFFMYYEDTDLSWRWQSRGWRILYQPKAVLRHIHAASSKEWSPRFVFCVERNRLLMLTANADSRLVTSAVVGYLREVAGNGLRDVKQLARTRQRPDLSRHRVRARVLTSLVAKTPHILAVRRQNNRARKVSTATLQEWLVNK